MAVDDDFDIPGEHSRLGSRHLAESWGEWSGGGVADTGMP